MTFTRENLLKLALPAFMTCILDSFEASDQVNTIFKNYNKLFDMVDHGFLVSTLN